MTQTVGGQPYFHPSDFEIDDAPYPVWQRMRDALPSTTTRSMDSVR